MLVTRTSVSSKPSLRRPGSGPSTERSASILSRLRALRRLTTRPRNTRYAPVVSKSREPLSSSASSTARFRCPCGPSIEPFSCARPRLLRLPFMS